MNFQTTDGIRYLTFDIFPPEVTHAVFTRQGGVSPEPWQSLNFGGTVGDEPARVRENRQRSFRALGCDPQSLFDVWQIHSADVVVATAPHRRLEGRHELKADAIITDRASVTLFMRFADCTPILLFDPVQRAIGIVHAGWVGTLKRAAGETVRAMSAAYGTRPADVRAAIGPSIGPDHYEVGPEVVERARYVFGAASETFFIINRAPGHTLTCGLPTSWPLIRPVWSRLKSQGCAPPAIPETGIPIENRRAKPANSVP